MEMLSNRSEGMPVQYITGYQEFMSLDFDVQPGVLIPRQDTEILAETVIGCCRKNREPATILDLGTGSGCIAVSLAYYLDECSVTAVDISEMALKIAYCNAVKNKVSERITFTAGNLFDNLGPVKFDVIVSNPPYARRHDIRTLQREVRDYEPVQALDGGEDGLWFYREIAGKAAGFLKPGGLLAFEVGYDQSDAVVQILEYDYTDIAVIKDLAGINRVVSGKLRNCMENCKKQ
jgi:release factor glutamine methyltransferase